MTAPTPQRAASAEERERHEPTDAEMQAEIAAEEAIRRAGLPRAVAPVPVRARYFLMECEHCGWIGSSELCGTDSGGDDSDIYCPACDAMTLGDEPSEADAAKFGQALFDRITAAEAELAEARADAETVSSLAGKLEADRNRLADEVVRLKRGVEAALTEACRPSAILLMAGEMTAQERRTARAVAEGLATKVRRALTATGGPTDGQAAGGGDA